MALVKRSSPEAGSRVRLDRLIGAGVAALLVASAVLSSVQPGRKTAGVAVAVAAGAAVLFRRRTAAASGVALAGLVSVFQMLTGQTGTLLIVPMLLAFYSIGAHAPLRTSVPAFVLAYAAVVASLYTEVENVAENAVFVAIIALATWGGGVTVRIARARNARLVELTAQLAHERDENARLAVAAERGRIARELHDVVAHGISVIAVQAGAGRHALHDDPERAHAAFAAIEETARQSLVEMRRMLGLLRDRHEPATPAPLPGLSERERLIEQARAAGLPVEVAVEGEPQTLPPGVDLAAFRVLQEALTNVRKHAPGAKTHVGIHYAPGELEITVRNGAAVNGAAPEPGAGHGLLGMRERVTLYGGSVAAGPAPEGGFRVEAHLPLSNYERT